MGEKNRNSDQGQVRSNQGFLAHKPPREGEGEGEGDSRDPAGIPIRCTGTGRGEKTGSSPLYHRQGSRYRLLATFIYGNSHLPPMAPEDSNPPVVCLGFDIHYPCYLNPGFRPERVKKTRTPEVNYFSSHTKEDLGWVIDRSFWPATEILLTLLDEGFRCALSISGVMLEHLERWYPEMLELLSCAATHQNAEVLAATYYHSVAGLFTDRQEFVDELLMHRDLMNDLFEVTPTTFVHTDYPITSATVKALVSTGIEAAIIEGREGSVLEEDQNQVDTCYGLPVLVTHCDLADDIAVRFPWREWDRWPLTADRYAGWIAASPGTCITLFLDYRIFGDAIGPETGILDFLRALPSALADAGVRTVHPADAARRPPLKDIGETGGHGHDRQQTIMQQSALEALEAAGNLVADREIWRYLLDTSHIRRMVMRPPSCGKPLHAVSHQATHDYFATFMRVLSHLEERSAASARSRRAVLSLRCVPPDLAFHFSSPDRPAGYAAHSLQELANMLEFAPDDVVNYHMERGDFDRWVSQVIGDTKLAKEIRGINAASDLQTAVQKRVEKLWNRLR